MTSGLLAKLQLFARVLASPRRAPPPRSRRKTARTALGFGLVAFLTASIGMAVALETVKPEWRDPEYGHRLMLLRLARQESPHRQLVVAVGTSRTQNAIFPGAMSFADAPGSPRVFNLGLSASPPLKEWLVLKRLLDAGVKPDAIIVELFPSSLGVASVAEQQFARQELRLSLADLGHLVPYCADPGALRTRWLQARVKPWLAQRQVLMNHWLPRWQPWTERFEFQWTWLDADGFQPIGEPGPASRAKAVAHARKEYAGAFARFWAAPQTVQTMRDLVALCRAEGIDVAFFIPPISPEFRASFAPGVYSAGEAAVLELGRQLEVPVFLAPRDLTEDEFLDGHHMLRRGAERYSAWLAENCLKPWLARSETGGSR